MASKTNLEALIKKYKLNPESSDYQKTKEEEEAEKEFNKYYSIKCIEALDGGDLAERLFSDSNSKSRGLFSWLEGGTKDVYGSAKPASCQVGILYKDDEYKIYKEKGKGESFDDPNKVNPYASQIKDVLLFIHKSITDIFSDQAITKEKYRRLSERISKELKENYHMDRDDIYYWYWNKKGMPNAFLLKYMHMSFPRYFSCTYSSSKLTSIVEALGKQADKSSNIVNSGIIAMFADENKLETRVLEKMLGEANFYEDDTTSSNHWVVVGNSKEFNHKKSLNEKNAIDWEQTKSSKLKQGNIVYIREDGMIRWKTKVEELDIPLNSYEGGAYWKPSKDFKENQKFVRLRLIGNVEKEEEAKETFKTLDIILRKGFKAIDEETAEVIDRYFQSTSNNVSGGKTPLNNGKKTYEYKKGEGVNKIFYGTPGCGKSYHVQKILKDNSVNDSNIYRVTFYQDYSYSDFVGQIMPKIDKINKTLTYDFVPGPFTLALKKAIIEPDTSVALVIEELNRGNAPAIFGDLFQLLDRNDDGVSRYPIRNENIVEFVNEHLDKNMYEDIEDIKIPSNLLLYATMNTSDQNVFTLDTAFKRRWKSEKISNEFKPEDDSISKKYIPGLNEITWEDFVGKINEHILEKATSLSSEDKQIGKYFVSENDLLDPKDSQDTIASKTRDFAYKVLEYLWDDVAKFNRSDWFIRDIRSLDQLINGYIEGKQVFIDELKMKPCSVSGGPKETQEKNLSGTEAETTDGKDN